MCAGKLRFMSRTDKRHFASMMYLETSNYLPDDRVVSLITVYERYNTSGFTIAVKGKENKNNLR